VPRRSHRTTRLTAVDLFCGCGGLTQGLRGAGFRVVAAVDNDPLSVTAYAANHRDVHVWGRDMRELAVASLREAGCAEGDLTRNGQTLRG
jgi:DNA (cytosine-5)-methyltransferase 1